jgi:hypothetical protein
MVLLCLVSLLPLAGCAAFDRIHASPVSPERVAPETKPTALRCDRVELTEYRNESGAWLAVPKRAVVTGKDAERFANLFPEVGRPAKRMTGTLTELPVRFEIALSSDDGQEYVIFVTAHLEAWWWDINVHPVSADVAREVLALAKAAAPDRSLVKSPVVRVEVVDWRDGYLRRRKIPIKAILTGRQAAALAENFPELGLVRRPLLATGSVPRFNVTFVRANGEQHVVEVFEEFGEPWQWCERGSFWLLGANGAKDLLNAAAEGKEDPSILKSLDR